MDELKRCPFCGEIPRTEMAVTQMGGPEDRVSFTIRCPSCGVYKTVILRINAYAHFLDVDKAESEVIIAWNKRVYTGVAESGAKMTKEEREKWRTDD